MLTYLASPYSGPSNVRYARFGQVCVAAGRLLQRGVFVFSPICQSHPIAEALELPTDYAFWDKFCRATLGKCDRVAVLMLDGWRESVGVTAEIKIAGEIGIPIVYLDPTTLEEVS